MKKPNVSRMLIGVVVAALAILIPAGWLIFSPGPGAASTIEIHDDAQLLQEDAFRAKIKDVKFWQPTHVAVVSLPDLQGKTLNDAVLDYARTQPTDVPWINPEDRQYWADSLFILAVAPNERLVGTYSGEDIAVGLDTQQEIQEATKDQFRSGDWAGGLVSGVKAGASVLGRPWTHSLLVKIALGVSAFCGAAWIFVVIRRKAAASKATLQARAAYANVTRDYEATEITAAAVPSQGTHSAAILKRFALFQDDYQSLTKSFNEFGSPTWLEQFTPAVMTEARNLAQQAETLDATDDSIAAAADFLNLRGDWQGAWSSEQGPLFEDLAGLESLLSKAPRGVPEESTREAQALLSSVPNRLAVMTRQLDERQLTPEAALDALDALSLEIHSAASKVVSSALETKGSESEKKRRREHWDKTNWNSHSSYSGTWAYQGYHGSYSPGATIRTNANTLGWSGTASPMTVPIAGLVVGYSTARSAAASSDSSGSGSSGYSGGGFSGSGSSSSF